MESRDEQYIVSSVGTHTLQRLYSSKALYRLYSATALHPLQYTALYSTPQDEIALLSQAPSWLNGLGWILGLARTTC